MPEIIFFNFGKKVLWMIDEIRGYRFKDPALLTNALCHSSYANEHKDKGVRSNERLEYLGDAVLGMISAEYIDIRICRKAR